MLHTECASSARLVITAATLVQPLETKNCWPVTPLTYVPQSVHVVSQYDVAAFEVSQTHQ
jgi:hypothetical protein